MTSPLTDDRVDVASARISQEPISDENLAAIRAGLEGVTPGPWVRHGGKFPYGWKGDVFAKDAASIVDASHIARCLGRPPNKRPLDELQDIGWARAQKPKIEANARHIANCDPQTILSLLARLDKAERERASLCDRNDELWAELQIGKTKLVSGAAKSVMYDAIEAALDDMGASGHSISGMAKAMLRHSIGPAIEDDIQYSYRDALKILVECDETHGGTSILRAEYDAISLSCSESSGSQLADATPTPRRER